ncbi:hypothetical protein Avbf_06670 [Armadillidium vulgare]|nr:hypothetical protein Avbf_06670 [Armadillidium vulgare]
MMSSLATAWKAVRPHTPLIKFRKGAVSKLGGMFKHESPVSEIPKPASHTVVKRPILEEWQLPANYYRPPFTEEEIEYINRGGPV